MSEVRVKVKLTNASDEALARRGQIPAESVRTYEADALIDTGAGGSVIPAFVMQQLGLMAYEQRVVQYADGRSEAVDVTEPVVFELSGRDTLEEAFVLGDEILIGRTVLAKTDLHVNHARQRLMPNPAHPDQPVTKVKTV